jgi:hypothetical protein
MTGAAVAGNMVGGLLPIRAVPQLDAISGIRFARPSYSLTHTGSVNSQGDASSFSSAARQQYGVTGAGVTVGVISDSYNRLGGAATDVATGDLPANVNLGTPRHSRRIPPEGSR